jgi:hypothetical protein
MYEAFHEMLGILRSVALVAVIGFVALISPGWAQGLPADHRSRVTTGYNPNIDAADFGHSITNKYCTYTRGMEAGYEMVTSRGLTHKQIDVEGDTKYIIGIPTTVVREREWLNGRLVEDTREWVAQDRYGNVWQFAEVVDHYKDGRLVNHDGSWEAGVNGAKPGILMLNEPKVGVSYRRDYYRGKAEDVGTVIAVGVGVMVPQGPLFQNCVLVREWSALKRESIEHKYSCVGIGTMVLQREKGANTLRIVSFKQGVDSHSVPTPRMASVP